MKNPGPHKADRLARLIRFVPGHERRVIVLATQGRTPAQIAEIMGIRETQAAATMANMLPQLNLDSWDAGMFQTRPVRRALEQARRRYGYDENPAPE